MFFIVLCPKKNISSISDLQRTSGITLVTHRALTEVFDIKIVNPGREKKPVHHFLNLFRHLVLDVVFVTCCYEYNRLPVCNLLILLLISIFLYNMLPISKLEKEKLSNLPGGPEWKECLLWKQGKVKQHPALHISGVIVLCGMYS